MLCVKASLSLIFRKQASVNKNVVSGEHITGTSQPILSKRSLTSLPPYSERIGLQMMRILQREGILRAASAPFTVNSPQDSLSVFRGRPVHIGGVGEIQDRDDCLPRKVRQAVADFPRVNIVKIVTDHHPFAETKAPRRIADQNYRPRGFAVAFSQCPQFRKGIRQEGIDVGYCSIAIFNPP